MDPSTLEVTLCEECGGVITVGLCSYECPWDGVLEPRPVRTVVYHRADLCSSPSDSTSPSTSSEASDR
jgi:hypothetical protein